MTHSATMLKLRRQFARERTSMPHLRPTAGVLKKTSPTTVERRSLAPTGGVVKMTSPTIAERRPLPPTGRVVKKTSSTMAERQSLPTSGGVLKKTSSTTAERKSLSPTGGVVKKRSATTAERKSLPTKARTTTVLDRGHRERAQPPRSPLSSSAITFGQTKRVQPPPPPPPSSSSTAFGQRERVQPPSPSPRSSSAASTFRGAGTLRCGTLVLVRTRVGNLPTGQSLVLWLTAVIVCGSEDGYVVIYNGKFPREDPFGTVQVPRDHVKMLPPSSFSSAAVPRPAPRPTTGGKSLRLIEKLEPEVVLSCC